MTDGFESYHEDFQMHIEDAMKSIKEMSQSMDPERKSTQSSDALKSIQEAERYYRILEGESRVGNAQQKRKMKEKLRGCKTQLEKLRAEHERVLLLSESKTRNHTNGNDPKSNLTDYLDRQNRVGDHVTNIQKTLAETEEIAVNIDTNLANQREHIERAQEHTTDVRGNTREAGTHIASLNRKMWTSKMCLYGVIILLFIAIVAVLGWKISGAVSNDKNTTSTDTPSTN